MRVLFSIVFISLISFSCSNNSTNNEDYTEEYNAATVTKVGEIVSGFSITTLEGTSVNIDSLKGRTIFLNFFTLSCPMCMKELPQLEKQIWNKYKNRDDFVILSIGREHTVQELKKFYRKKQFNFPMAADVDRSVYARFAEKFVPRNIIIDKEGKVVYTAVGYNEKEGLSELIQAIKKELGE